MRSRCKIKQRDVTDCGVACLASIAAHHGLFMPLGKLRQWASTDKFGTTVAGLINAAAQLSLKAKAVRAEIANLTQLPAPFIAHVIRDKMQHYIVIYKVSGSFVTYMDPADGCYHKEKLNQFKNSWSGILVLLMPDDQFKKEDKRISDYAWYWQLVKGHKFLLFQSIFAAVVYTILGLAPSFYIQKIIDQVLTDHNFKLLNLLTIITLACLILQVTIGYLKSFFILHTGQYIDAKLIMGYCRHLLRLPQTFFDNMQVGEIVSRVNDAVKIRTFINNTGIDMLLNIFIISFSFVIMVMYNWKLALLVFLIFPAYIIIYTCNNYLNKKWQRRVMENAAKVESQLVETLGTMRTIKRFAAEEYMNLKIDNRVVELLKTVFQSSNYNLYIVTTSEFLLRAISIIMLCAGSYYVLKSQLTVGELLSFYSLLGYFTGPATALMSANRSLQEASIACNRLLDIADLDTEPSPAGRAELSRSMIGDIIFNNVHFKYGSRGNLFEGLSMKIHSGQSTAIVGESGSGKSTILSLLLNLYPIEKGRISIGEFNLKNITNDSLRSCIAIVPQEIQLLSCSLIENIAIGEYEPDIKRIIGICQLLGLEEFISELPLGYNSTLGEQGMSLSGGQRQRLAIARALYRQPEILLLDEATSSLDAVTELKVQEALLWYLKQGKTLIIVAHRLITIRNCHDIKVLSEGKLIEEGTHEQLMSLNGNYAGMWKENLSKKE